MLCALVGVTRLVSRGGPALGDVVLSVVFFAAAAVLVIVLVLRVRRDRRGRER